MPALAAGASLLMFFGPWIIPVAGSLFSIWTPAPILTLYRRRGRSAGRLALGLALVGALGLGAVFSSATGGLYFLYYAAVALVLGEAPGLGWSEPRAVTMAGFVAAGLVGGLLLGGSLSAGQDMAALWDAQWQQELEALVGGYQRMGLDAEQAREAQKGLVEAGRLFLRLSPGLLVSGSLLLAWANLVLARRTSLAAGETAAEQARLSLFKLPEPLVWVLILAGGAAWAGEGWWFWGAVNVLMVLGVAYFFQGLAVLVYWLEKKNAPRILRLGVYALLAVEAFLAILVALAGLFDIWFNFRRLEKTPPA
jgi:hypothetical protein